LTRVNAGPQAGGYNGRQSRTASKPVLGDFRVWEHSAMLTLRDCIDLCDLTEDEILAIAEHEHIPEIIAMEYGQYLIHCDDGEPCIRAIIRDDIRHAEQRGEKDRVVRLKLVLKHFIDSHGSVPAA
jgi:hypothetical protein